MKQNWSKIAIALGPAIVMVSIVWEMARTNPAYNFLVEPWAMKGYEMDQGWTYLAVGVVLLLMGLAVMSKRAVEVPYSAAVVTFVTVAATVPAVVYGPETVSITFSGVIVAILTLTLTLVIYRTFKSLVLPRVPDLDRFIIRVVLGLRTLVALFLILSVSLGGPTIDTSPGLPHSSRSASPVSSPSQPRHTA